MVNPLGAGREHFARREWAAAYDALVSTEPETLDAADCERVAVAAYLIGRDGPSAQAWERAYRRHVEAEASDEAARCAFWLGFGLLMTGQMAQAGGWFGRAAGLVEEGTGAGAGYLMIPRLLGALEDGDAEGARDLRGFTRSRSALDATTRTSRRSPPLATAKRCLRSATSRPAFRVSTRPWSR